MPAPLSATVCGLPEALSLTASVADRAPRALGVKVTLIVQLAPAATLVPQSFVWAKSLLFGPVIATLVIFSAWLPVFESVTVCVIGVARSWLPKVRLGGESVASTPNPVPDRVML